MVLIGHTPPSGAPLPTQAELEQTVHECGDGWLIRDRTDPNIRWCLRCGACQGAPGGRQPTIPLADTNYGARGAGAVMPAESTISP